MTTIANEPAMPIKNVGVNVKGPEEVIVSFNDQQFDFTANFPGLSKLEYFAAKAMQGILSHYGLPKDGWVNSDIGKKVESMTIASVACAKALINELNKQQ